MIIEVSRQLAVNLFWVLAAVIEVFLAVLLILGLVFAFSDRLHRNNKEEDEE